MNKGEISEFYAFLKLIWDNKLFFSDSNLNKTEDFLIITKLAENNYQWSIRINDDETISLVSKKENIEETIKIPDILSRKFLDNFYESIKSGSQINFNYIQEKLKIKSIKGSKRNKSDFLITFSYEDLFVNEFQGISVKSNLGGNSTILNANGDSTNFIYEVLNFKGDPNEINSINGSGKIIKRINSIIKKNGAFKFFKCHSEIFDKNLRKVDSLMPQKLANILLKKYINQESDFPNLINDDVDKVHFTSLLKAAAFGMFPSIDWDGTYSIKGILIVRKEGDLVIFHTLKEKDLNEFLFSHSYIETPSSSRHSFGKLYKDDGRMFFKLNCQLRMYKNDKH